MGDLIIAEDEESYTLTASVIWARGGRIIAGSPTKPYSKKFVIELVGGFDDPYLLIDPFIEASNKVLAVTNVKKNLFL